MKIKIFLLICFCITANCRLSLFAQTWNTVGDSAQILNYDSLTPGGTVFVIKQIDSLLYVGGGFVNAGDLKVNSIATWDGTKWDSLNSEVNGGVYDICQYNSDIFIGGYFGLNGVPNGCFARWDGSDWFAVGSGLTYSNGLKALKFNNNLYIGGSITQIGTLYPHNIASWDGSNYAGLNGGVVGPFEKVNALTEYNNELIAGGYFNYAGGNEAFNIAAWDGINWHALDTGTSEIVNALVVDTLNNFLYVGGGFTSVGGIDGINTTAIARWDGYQWDSLAGGLPYCDVYALAIYHNNLFAGFCLNGGMTNPPGFAKWNGKEWSTWNALNGPNDVVFALGVFNDELYVGGAFTKIGSDSVFGIAHYYEPLDTTCDYLQAIIQPKNIVLNISDSTTVHFYNNIIHGSSWHWNFGDGGTDTVRVPVHTYAGAGVYNVTVIVTYQNCTDTAYTTVTIVDDVGIKDNKDDTMEYLGNNIPNPFDNSTTIPYYVPSGSKGFLQITDTKGELVDEYALQQEKNELDVSLEYLKAGTYFYSIVIDGVKKDTKKMVLQ